mmetsp:Transcript_35129/g.70243  ORF Transcript_35129/g.70243 Transcript_35129/m.70243 type:complete len:205 (+) Transcript_35129:98-712(+)
MRRGFCCMMLIMVVVCGTIALFLRDVHNVTQDKIVSLKNDLVSAVQERDAIKTELDNLKKTTTDTQTQLKQITDDSSTLRSGKEAAERQVSTLQAELKTSQDKTGSLEATTKELQQELDSFKSKLSSHERKRHRTTQLRGGSERAAHNLRKTSQTKQHRRAPCKRKQKRSRSASLPPCPRLPSSLSLTADWHRGCMHASSMRPL